MDHVDAVVYVVYPPHERAVTLAMRSQALWSAANVRGLDLTVEREAAQHGLHR